MRIFITGITGFIGRHLVHLWQKDGQMVLTGSGRSALRPADLPEPVEYFPLDITYGKSVQAVLSLCRPDVVIHLAAISRPNDCETDRELSYKVNVEASERIARICKALRIRLVYISSDMVFGDHGPYAEDHPFCPVNYYGETKQMAEEGITRIMPEAAIVRTVLVYGKKLPGLKDTFLHWVYNNLQAGKTIQVYTDQFRTATFVNDLCLGINSIVQQEKSGAWHLCGLEEFTPYEMAQRVAAYIGYAPSLVQPITSAERPEAARRPAKSTLDIGKAQQAFGYATTPLEEAMVQVFG
jgi:dTDP-4-dehydrorhamnose reductase